MSMPDEFYHEMEMREAQADLRACSTLLNKLPVAALRTLCAYYLGKDQDWARREVKSWPKSECVSYLAEEHLEDVMHRVWTGK